MSYEVQVGLSNVDRKCSNAEAFDEPVNTRVTASANGAELGHTESYQVDAQFTRTIQIPADTPDDTPVNFTADGLGNTQLTVGELKALSNNQKASKYPIHSNDERQAKELARKQAAFVLRVQHAGRFTELDNMVADLQDQVKLVQDTGYKLHAEAEARDDALIKLNDDHAAILKEFDTTGNFNPDTMEVGTEYNDTELDRYDALNKEMRTSFNFLHITINQLKDQVADLENKDTDNTQRIEQLNTENEDKDKQLQELKDQLDKAIADRDQTIEDLKKQLEDSEKERDALQTEKDTLYGDMGQLRELNDRYGGLVNEDPADRTEARIAGAEDAAPATEAEQANGQNLELQLKARDLVQMDWLSKSDPITAVYAKEPEEQDWKLVGQTEWQKNTHNPDFETRVNILVQPNDTRQLKFSVYDVDAPEIAEKDIIASSAPTTVAEVVANAGTESKHVLSDCPHKGKQARKLKKAGSHVLVNATVQEGGAAPAKRSAAPNAAGNNPEAVKDELKRLNKLNDALDALLKDRQAEEEKQKQALADEQAAREAENTEKDQALADEKAAHEADNTEKDNKIAEEEAAKKAAEEEAARLAQDLQDKDKDLTDIVNLIKSQNDEYRTLVEEPDEEEEATLALDGLAELRDDAGADKEVSLNIKARDLVQMDWLSKSDPIVGVFAKEPAAEQWAFVGKTEWKKNEHNPDFNTPVVLKTFPNDTRQLKFTIFDVDEPTISDKDEMSHHETTVAEVLKNAGTETKYLCLDTPRDAKTRRKLKKAKTHVLIDAQVNDVGAAPAARKMPAAEKRGVSSGAPVDDDEEDGEVDGKKEVERFRKLNDTLRNQRQKDAEERDALEKAKADEETKAADLAKQLEDEKAAHEADNEEKQRNIENVQADLDRAQADADKRAQEQDEAQRDLDDKLRQLAERSRRYDSLLPGEGEVTEMGDPEEDSKAIMTGFPIYQDKDKSGTPLNITLGVRKLIKMDWLSKSDPLVALFVQGKDGQKDQYVGMTEWQKNQHDCTFEESIKLRYHGASDDRVLRFAVYDLDKALIQHEKDLIGEVIVPVKQLVSDVEGKESTQYPLTNQKTVVQRKLTKKKSHIVLALRSEEKEMAVQARLQAEEEEKARIKLAAMGGDGEISFQQQLDKLSALNDRLAEAEKRRAEKESASRASGAQGEKAQQALQDALQESKDAVDRLAAREADLKKKFDDQAAEIARLQAEVEAGRKTEADMTRRLKEMDLERSQWLSEVEEVHKQNEAYANLLEDPEQGADVNMKDAVIVPEDKAFTERAQLNFGIRRLVSTDVLSKSDPLVAVYVQDAGGKGGWKYVGKTEYVRNAVDRDFHREVLLDHAGAKDNRKVRLAVYNVDHGAVTEKNLVGEHFTTVKELLAKQGEPVSECQINHPKNKKLNRLLERKKTCVVYNCYRVERTEYTDERMALQRRVAPVETKAIEPSLEEMRVQVRYYEMLNGKLRRYLTTEGEKREGFSLSKCVQYTKDFLKVDPEDELHFSREEFCNGLEMKYRHVDQDDSGLVNLQELREAVWNNEEDNEGLPCPDGPLPPALQDVVDEIYNGTGAKREFTFWDFVPYMLNEEGITFEHLPTPPANQYWAHAKSTYDL